MVSVHMPPVPLMVLDGLADDIENVESLRDHGEVTPYGLALVEEQEVVAALRNLLKEGLVEALQLAEPELELVPANDPSSDDASLRQYWFRWTAAGERAWREGRRVLDAYWDAHPPGG
jgi:hypothetical protein